MSNSSVIGACRIALRCMYPAYTLHVYLLLRAKLQKMMRAQ